MPSASDSSSPMPVTQMRRLPVCSAGCGFFEKMMLAFVPPNANEFDMTFSSSRSRATFTTQSRFPAFSASGARSSGA